MGISRRCARLSYVAIVVHGSCSPQAPIAPHVWYGLRALCQAHRLPPSHSTHFIVFSACAIKIAPFTSLALRSQRRLGTVSPFGLLPLQNPFRLHTPYCLVALSSLGLRSFSPINKHIPVLSLCAKPRSRLCNGILAPAATAAARACLTVINIGSADRWRGKCIAQTVNNCI